MSGFIAVAEAGPGQCVAVANSRFWPDIDLKVLREAMRIDATVTAARLLGAVTEAMASVNHELRGWRQQQQALGYAAAEEVPAEQIAGASIVLHRYLRAVGCRTKASLVERLRDFDTTAGGESVRKTRNRTSRSCGEMPCGPSAILQGARVTPWT